MFGQRYLPKEILSPLGIYSEESLKRLIRESDIFSKNDNFRLIIISKSIDVP